MQRSPELSFSYFPLEMTIPTIHRNLKKLNTMPGDTTKEENQLNEFCYFKVLYGISLRYLIEQSKKEAKVGSAQVYLAQVAQNRISNPQVPAIPA